MILTITYGHELRYSQRFNRKGRLIYALYGETYPGHLIRYFVNRRYIKRYVQLGNGNMLEIGSACGPFAFWLSRNRRYNVDAIEINSALVNDCEVVRQRIKRDNLRFICADASQRLPLDSKYDIIFFSHVLEHVDDDALLTNAYKYLRRGGLLILQVPYGDPRKLPSKEDLENGHVREGYTESDIREKLEYAGFEVVTAAGGVGKIGIFAYRFSKRVSKLSHRLAITLFPAILFLVYMEQISALLRKHEPHFKHGPVILARKHL